MRLFARKKSAGESTDAVAQRLANGITAKQRALADYLNFKTRHLTPRFWKYAVVAFCMVFGGYCIYLVLSAIN